MEERIQAQHKQQGSERRRGSSEVAAETPERKKKGSKKKPQPARVRFTTWEEKTAFENVLK